MKVKELLNKYPENWLFINTVTVNGSTIEFDPEEVRRYNLEDKEVKSYDIDECLIWIDDPLVRNEYDEGYILDDIAMYMDDDLREELNYQLAPCTDQEFFDAYAEAHEEKFGEEWELSKENPCY